MHDETPGKRLGLSQVQQGLGSDRLSIRPLDLVDVLQSLAAVRETEPFCDGDFDSADEVSGLMDFRVPFPLRASKIAIECRASQNAAAGESPRASTMHFLTHPFHLLP